MTEEENNKIETVLPIQPKKKRGRKKGTKSEKRKGYFYEPEEDAVREYIRSSDQAERSRIFEEKLREPFRKMVESLIRGYKLHIPDQDFDDTFNDTINFLFEKIDKFNPKLETKAYSYCGTICKRYLINEINKTKLRQIRYISYEDVSSDIEENERYSYNNSSDSSSLHSNIVSTMIEEIQTTIDSRTKIGSSHLRHEDLIVGNAVIELLKNWEEVLETLGSNKLNKNGIIYFIQELTMLTPSEIKLSLKKYKTLYKFVKRDILNEE